MKIRLHVDVTDYTTGMHSWNKKMSKSFDAYMKKNFQERSKAIVHLNHNAKKYWEQNVYEVFDKRLSIGKLNSGQLGKSLQIGLDSGKIVFGMKRLIHNDEAISGGKDWDYGRYLRNDRGFTNAPQENFSDDNPPKRFNRRYKPLKERKNADDKYTVSESSYSSKDRGTYNSYYDAKVFIGKGQNALSPRYWQEWEARYVPRLFNEVGKVVPYIVDDYFRFYGFKRSKK